MNVDSMIFSRMPEEHWLFAIRREGGVSRYFQPLVSPVDWDRWKDRAFSKSPKEADFLVEFGGIMRGFEKAQVIAR